MKKMKLLHKTLIGFMGIVLLSAVGCATKPEKKPAVRTEDKQYEQFLSETKQDRMDEKMADDKEEMESEGGM